MLAVERPVVLPQASSRIVLLAFTGPLVPRRGVATALAGAVNSGATIVATHLLPVALHLPMDAPVVEGEARARELLGAVQASPGSMVAQAIVDLHDVSHYAVSRRLIRERRRARPAGARAPDQW